MRRIVPVLLATSFFWSAAGFAHTHLVSSSPADHAELATAPKEAILTFAEAVILTAAKLESTDGKTVLKPLPDGSVKEAHIPLPTLAAGHYRLQWRATSDDGHVMSGELSFDVNGPVAK
jgi:methionine-rich copper-binding protein CopC